MFKRLTTCFYLLLFLSFNAPAALVEGNGYVNGAITLSSYSSDLADAPAVGLAFEFPPTDFQFGSGAITSFNTPPQSFAPIGIGDTIETVVDVNASVSGPLGGASRNLEENLIFGLTNLSATLQTLVLDVLVDLQVSGNDAFGAALAGGNSYFTLAVGRSFVGDFSDATTLAEDSLFVQSTGGMGPLALQMLFDESYSFDLAPGEGLAVSLRTGVVAAAVSPVPVPAAIWLFGSALFGLFGARLWRRR